MNESHDNLLTQALESVPQAPLPPGFVNRVMTRIEPAPLPPRFRLQFVDLAVPAFASLLLVTLILLAAQTDWLPLLLGGGVGGVEEGVEGVWGVVGVLALGQPESNRQAQATAARRASTGPGLLFDIICPDQFFRRYRLLALEAGTEPDVAQIAQQAQRHVVQLGVVVQPLQVFHPAARIHVEFYQ